LFEEAPRLVHEVVKTLVAAVDELTGTRHGVLDLLERKAGWAPGRFFFGHGASLSDTCRHEDAEGRSVASVRARLEVGGG
jgi:hypothetical protein